MTIPLLDLATQYENLREELTPALERVLQTGHFILGEEVDLFEEKFAAFCSADYCVSVASGTDALHLALRALNIGPGDEVLVPANTFAATAFAVAYTGATPVFVDVRPTDFNLDPELIESALTPHTKAIIPVHLYGHPADMDAILEIAKRKGLSVVEDACQAHGALHRRRPAGSIGDLGCFSFYPGKNLGAYGDGGAIVTNNADLANKLRLLRNYGQRTKNVHTMVAYNSRLDTLQAAVLLVKLNYLDDWNERRRSIAAQYREQLADADIILPRELPDVRHVYHQFVIQHAQRDELMSRLKAQGVSTGIHYPVPLNQAAPFVAARTVPHGVPVCTALAQRIVSLPMFPELTDDQVSTVTEAISTATLATQNA